MAKTYTPLLSEVLKKVHNAKTKEKKIELLKEYDCEPLRMVIKSSFDPNIEWVLPKGDVPYTPNEAEEGTEHTVLRKEARKLYRLHSSEAQLILDAKDKKLHQVYKGLSDNVVKEAFDWNDNYTRSA